jgi:hypothetical protein
MISSILPDKIDALKKNKDPLPSVTKYARVEGVLCGLGIDWE